MPGSENNNESKSKDLTDIKNRIHQENDSNNDSRKLGRSPHGRERGMERDDFRQSHGRGGSRKRYRDSDEEDDFRKAVRGGRRTSERGRSRDRTPERSLSRSPSRTRSRPRSRPISKAGSRSSKRSPSRSRSRSRSWSRSRSPIRSRSRSRSKRYRSPSPRYRRRPSRSRSYSRSRSRSYSRSSRDYDYRRSGGRNQYNRNYRDSYDDRRYNGRYQRGPERRARTPPVDRDRRTVFVQQLAARLKEYQLMDFFEDNKVGRVIDASIVKDRISNRSKGMAYVEFEEYESVQKAIALTGKSLLGIPIIVQVTEAEKNRMANEKSLSEEDKRERRKIFICNIKYTVGEEQIRTLFSPFGTIESIRLQRDEAGNSKGFGYLWFANEESVAKAIKERNEFMVQGRAMRVTGGDAKEAIAFQGSAFESNKVPGDSGRYKGGDYKSLDDGDGGVSMSNNSRVNLMQKLMRAEDKEEVEEKLPLPRKESQPSRCILLTNMFDIKEETGNSWIKDLEEDVRDECEEKYGKVDHLAVDANSLGEIYIKFNNVESGKKAVIGLNGRFFGGRKVTASPIVERVYDMRFSK